jgi:hypothetical protein
LRWPIFNLAVSFRVNRKEKIALSLVAALGACFGPLLGYFLFAVAHGAEGAIDFGRWIRNPIDYPGLYWAVFGAGVGATVFGIWHLTRTQGDP